MLKLSPADLCHAVLLKKPFMADGWLWEMKHDGFRAFVRRSRAEVQLFSRNGRSMANAFPEITSAIATLPTGVYDGELVLAENAESERQSPLDHTMTGFKLRTLRTVQRLEGAFVRRRRTWHEVESG